jgi:hypothetical protein
MKQNNIRVVNLSGDYILPSVAENRTKKQWVEYGITGADDFFSTITKKYLTSPTNQSCIDGIVQLLYGLGLKSDLPEIEKMLETLTEPEEIKRIVQDYKLYGVLSIQCVFSPDRGKLIGFYHIPVDTLRAEKCDENGDIGGYYYSSDWSNKRIEPTYIPVLGSSEYENDVQVLYFKRYTPGMYYYSLPDWFSSIQYSSVEEEISNLHISNIRNGFLAGAMLNFNGGLPPIEEQQVLEASIASKFSGTSNAGRFILSFNESKEEATTIDMIKSENLHENYRFLSEEAKDKIMLSHRITSQLLFGIKSASGFSSNADELKTSYDIFMKMVINPMQNEILRAFKTVLEINGIVDPQLYFEALVPYEIEADMVDKVGQANTDEMINESEQTVEDATQIQNIPVSE